MRYRFNPFGKDLGAIEAEDLNILREVHEGWYVDYKRECQNIRDTAKSLSAFANQFGGWLFIGITEGENKSMTAGSFPGIPAADIPASLGRLRDASSAHISPNVYFEHKVINGPSATLGLPDHRAIIVVFIPEGTNPPFVHSSGRIFRRVADTSTPVAETDRHVLDMLWQKERVAQDALSNFIAAYPRRLNVLDTSSFSHIFLLPDLSFQPSQLPLTLHEFREIMRTQNSATFLSMSFDTIFPTVDGFVARRTAHAPENTIPLSFRWWNNGNCRLTIPIPRIWVNASDPTLKVFSQPNADLIDFREWIPNVLACLDKLHTLNAHLQSDPEIHAKIHFTNMAAKTAFINLPSHLETINNWGLPKCEEDDILVPPGLNRESFVTLQRPTQGQALSNSLVAGFPLLIEGLKATGVTLSRTQLGIREVQTATMNYLGHGQTGPA